MIKTPPKTTFSPLSLLKVLGRPWYYLFTFCLLFLFLFFQVFFRLLRLIKVPRIRFSAIQTLSVILVIIIGFSFYLYILRDLPPVSLLSDSPPSLTTKIFDRHGVLLYQIYKDENRSLIRLADLPPYLISATLAAEDKNFYSHPGIDFVGITRAVYHNFLNCNLKHNQCTPEGGSTITQQLIKNSLLSPERTLQRKLKELILSLQAELIYSKDEILTMYLNQVGYGGTAYGIEQASWQYFGKSAANLTLAESALLAGLPIAPTTLSPFGTNPHLAKIRQQQVLENMVKMRSLSEAELAAALALPLSFHPQEVNLLAPHFVMYVKNQLVELYGEDVVARGGLSVTTTLDLSLQNFLQQAINSELASLTRLNVTNGAGLILTPNNGEILAMVGSHNFFDAAHDGQVNVTLQPRQPGSSIKPITYALALSRGLNPSSPIDDSPICFRIQNQPDYCPQNYDGRFHGRISLRTALGSSYNIPAIKLLNNFGLDNMIALARQLGITTWEDPSRFGLSLTLGGGEVTMLDLASVYTVFANGGTKVPLHSLLSVTDSQGNSLPLPPNNLPNPSVLDPAIAYQINSILSDPLARAPAFGNHSVLNVDPSIAVKTGTTNNLRDNWTFGYTPNLLVATWVGNNDNSPMSRVASGVTGASPIWAKVIKTLLPQFPKASFTPPSYLVKANVSCGTPRYEYFLPGNTPILHCSPSPSQGSLLDSAAATSPR